MYDSKLALVIPDNEQTQVGIGAGQGVLPASSLQSGQLFPIVIAVIFVIGVVYAIIKFFKKRKDSKYQRN